MARKVLTDRDLMQRALATVSSAGEPGWISPAASERPGWVLRKESQDMLISQTAQCEALAPQGSGRESLAELRRRLANPVATGEGTRQRLVELAERLARVRALGGEYGRVDFSERAAAAMKVAVGA